LTYYKEPNIEGLSAYVKNIVKELQDLARKLLPGEPNVIYTTKLQVVCKTYNKITISIYIGN